MGMTGCATAPRQQLLERSAAYVAYSLPPEQVLQVARELLQEQGYILMESRDPLYVRTSWQTKFDDSLDVGALRVRMFVMGKELEDGRFALTAYRATYTTIGRTAPHPAETQKNDETPGVQRMVKGDPLSYVHPEIVRDLDLEWQILSRVSPSVAHALESQVDQYLATKSK
ncbi:hypothetical protein [Archangium sp.]|uniref:hypothetical protein n=1 Tax=Archangium sp. TaxID=1872627 RepID=UPI00389ADE9B